MIKKQGTKYVFRHFVKEIWKFSLPIKNLALL